MTTHITKKIQDAYDQYMNQPIDWDALGQPITRKMTSCAESIVTFAAGYERGLSSKLKPMDNGPWGPGVTSEVPPRVFVESDDFKHDVRLYINGDFEDLKQQTLYATDIALQLNFARKTLKKNLQSLSVILNNDLSQTMHNLVRANPFNDKSTLITRRFRFLSALLPAIIFLEENGEPVSISDLRTMDCLDDLVLRSTKKYGFAFVVVAASLTEFLMSMSMVKDLNTGFLTKSSNGQYDATVLSCHHLRVALDQIQNSQSDEAQAVCSA